MTERQRNLAIGIWVSFRAEVVRLLRRRGVVALTFLFPVLVSAVVVFALGSAEQVEPSAIGWVATAPAPSVVQFVDRVVGADELDDFVSWTPVASVAAAETALRDEELGAVIVVGPGRGPAGPAELEVLGDEDPLASGVAATIVDEYRVGYAAAVMAFEHGVALPERTDDPLALTAPGGRSLDASVHWGPALGAFLVLLGMGHAAHRQVDDRHRGIAARVASTVTPRGAVVVGRSLAATTIGASVLLVMAASTQVLFGRSWGPWGTVAIVAVATAVAVAGVGALIATLARSPGQAQSLTAVAAFVLALGGGSFTPLGGGSEPGSIARWLPTSLSLEGFSAAATGGSARGVLAPVVALLVIGMVLLPVAGVLPTVRGRT